MTTFQNFKVMHSILRGFLQKSFKNLRKWFGALTKKLMKHFPQGYKVSHCAAVGLNV